MRGIGGLGDYMSDWRCEEHQADGGVLTLRPLYHIFDGAQRLKLLADVTSLMPLSGILFAGFVSVLTQLQLMATDTPQRLLDRRDFHKKSVKSGSYVSSNAGAMHHVYPLEVHATMEAILSLQMAEIFGAEVFFGSFSLTIIII